MLPGLNGYEVLRRRRARNVWTPVTMLTAKDGEYHQTAAFDLGTDDYLTKPFSFIVLEARLRALLRRAAPRRPATLKAGINARHPPATTSLTRFAAAESMPDNMFRYRITAKTPPAMPRVMNTTVAVPTADRADMPSSP